MQFGCKLSTELQLNEVQRREQQQQQRCWWWCTNTSLPFVMFSCVWPFQLHAVSWEGRKARESMRDGAHAGESASDTCCTEWVRKDTWRAEHTDKSTGKRGGGRQTCMWEKAGSRDRRGFIEWLGDKHRDINYLWPHTHPCLICPPCRPLPWYVKRVLFITCGWMRESGGLSSGNCPRLKGECMC